MEKAWNDKFGFEIVAKGQFVDQGYLVKTIVIRLSGSALNAWLESEILSGRMTYETEKAWNDYKARKVKLREDWERKILQKLNFEKNDNTSACIAQNVSELFTVVLMEPSEEGEEPYYI